MSEGAPVSAGTATSLGTSAQESRPVRLSLRGMGKSFAGIQVLHGVDLDVREGEVVALLGENGAGKSTLSAIIAGLIKPSEGTMLWENQPYAPDRPGAAIAAGVGLIHQELRLLPDLTIAENVFVGRLPMRGGCVDREGMNRRAGDQLRRLGLDVPPTRPPCGRCAWPPSSRWRSPRRSRCERGC